MEMQRCWNWLHHQMVNCVSSTSIQIRFKKVLTVFEGESSHCPMPPCKTTKLQIRASEEMCPSYRCGIEKTSSQMRTPDHQGGSNRLFSQKYRQWLQRKSTCCSTSLVRYILFSLDWWSAYRDVVVSVKHLCIKQNKVFLIYINLFLFARFTVSHCSGEKVIQITKYHQMSS